MTERESKELNTIHERDLDIILDKIQKKEDLDTGKIKCKFCGITIDRDNLYSFLPEPGAVNFICDKSECVGKLLEYIEEKKRTRLEK